MKLCSLDDPALFELAAAWLAAPENYEWLDFGGGRQVVTPPLLKVMVQRDTHFVRAYLNDAGEPIGVLGLNGVDRRFGTAMFWGVAGEKSFRNRGYGTLASSKFLTLAFRDLGLHVINTWAVEHNPSRRIIERLGFQYAGRQRECHRMAGRIYDRVLYDLLASEHRELSESDFRRGATARRATTPARRLARSP